MDMPAITEALRAKLSEDCGLGAVLKFDCGADGVAVIDGKSVPNTISNEDREADCTVAISKENLAALLKGELNPMNGFMMGKFKVSGDMSVAMKLQRVV
ncbi:SCP2 sterol-binding domain-containing protein [Roseateles koreensis]|uniref:SCP2 sterol-binding domain-containing protein n=1 Tax=Roseateles koreensis TaxID=2987526 RepID=A0ABT5KRF1_9BURK|nr:SCP2 sterol-binding domain-containing protein [Roseateles koreensis]MDC8785416.1 SCP2 sterol-binding domain-containing protein [Roseateles koreensis]